MANFKANRTEEDILREMTAILRELKDPRPVGLQDLRFQSVRQGNRQGILQRSGQCLRLYPAGTASPSEDPAESGTAFCGRRFDRT